LKLDDLPKTAMTACRSKAPHVNALPNEKQICRQRNKQRPNAGVERRRSRPPRTIC
jgi:hypothetical protein